MKKVIGFISVFIPLVGIGVVLYLYFRRKQEQYDALLAIEQGLDTDLSPEQKTSLDWIMKAWNEYGDGDKNKLAYILATAWHESSLKPVKERRAAAGTALYNQQNNYWPSGYFGRGFVQLTWDSNYAEMSNILGVDLLSNPDLALRPEYAADILVIGMMDGTFTRKKLRQYINESGADFYNARKVVNGLDRAETIKGYAKAINKYL